MSKKSFEFDKVHKFHAAETVGEFFLSKKYGYAYALIDEGKILINGKQAYADTKIKNGDRIKMVTE